MQDSSVKTNKQNNCFSLEKRKVTDLDENTAIKRFWPDIKERVYNRAHSL